jgi:hypothetical protein
MKRYQKFGSACGKLLWLACFVIQRLMSNDITDAGGQTKMRQYYSKEAKGFRMRNVYEKKNYDFRMEIMQVDS